MTDTTLATTLWDLKVAGQEIQDMGAAHSAASAVVSGMDPTGANDRPGTVGLGADAFSGAWNEAAAAVVSMLTANAALLADCGNALIWCADNNYAVADDEVRGYFDLLDAADPDHG
ncbi:hypothetical protein FE634_21745 [Nocardioides dongxiaopingii]|uniref:hypothetical protein n=1 Tax=Nocardioides TaxID=1839 RepID=UPI0010C76A98|nr:MULTISPECIES: hypothetical protein [Nocardioides]QDH10902.1 hypothetical protein FE634_21745 [Nocardioides sp. S-1144]